MRSLYMAGMPKDALFFITGGHDVGSHILSNTDRGMIFGNKSTIDAWKDWPNIDKHGPGSSMTYDEILTSQTLDSHARGMMEDGGRGCVNTTALLTPPERARITAREIYGRAKSIEIKDPLDPEAVIPAYKNAEQATGINMMINQMTRDGAIRMNGNLLSRIRGKGDTLVERDGVRYLKPTVVFCETPDHPLFGMELPMQFLTVSEIPREEVLKRTENALILSLFANDDSFVNEVEERHTAGVVYRNRATCDIDPARLPHRVVEHLYDVNVMVLV